MNSLEKKVHDLEQRVSALESEVAELKAAKAAAATDAVPAEESAGESSAA